MQAAFSSSLKVLALSSQNNQIPGILIFDKKSKGIVYSDTRAQVFTDSLTPAPLEALAARLQDCLYRADRFQETCDALLSDFPAQQTELRELSAWIAHTIR